MRNIFMAVGIPDPVQDKKYHRVGDVILIREAVIELTRVVLQRKRDNLIYIDHPAVSPLLVRIADRCGARSNLIALRSVDSIPEQSIDAAFLLGGTQETATYWNAICVNCTRVYPVASTGGLARELYDQGQGPANPIMMRALGSTDVSYELLFEDIYGP